MQWENYEKKNITLNVLLILLKSLIGEVKKIKIPSLLIFVKHEVYNYISALLIFEHVNLIKPILFAHS